jgi:hypothetical protein
MAHLREKKGNYYAEFYDPQRQPKRKWVTLRSRHKAAAQSRMYELQRKYHAGAYDPWEDPSDRPSPSRRLGRNSSDRKAISRKRLSTGGLVFTHYATHAPRGWSCAAYP